MEILWFITGLLVGSASVWAALRARQAHSATGIAALEQRLDRSEAERQTLTESLAASQQELARASTSLEHERRSAEEKAAAAEQAREELTTSFKALSSDALARNNRAFLELVGSTLDRYQAKATDDFKGRAQAIEQLVKPIREALEKVDGQMQQAEQGRRQAHGALGEQIRLLAESEERLRSETSNLVTALRAPAVRGRWGEMQLRRVVEVAGMLAHCDFEEQATVQSDGQVLRPDLVVRLPGGKSVVVDAKAPLAAYLDAVEADDPDTQTARLRDHARQLGDHVAKLSAKAYWEQFDAAPDFVILFLPGEPFFSEALRHDPGLIETAARQRVFIATPVTLLSVLNAVAYGWQQETVAEGAREIAREGRELYERIATVGEHLEKLGRSIESTVRNYNSALGSLELRVFPSVRRLAALGVRSAKEVPDLLQLEHSARRLQAPEFAGTVATASLEQADAVARQAAEPGGAPGFDGTVAELERVEAKRTADSLPEAAAGEPAADEPAARSPASEAA
ncbi:MAG: DNA recombination protein RmuC [Actinomycetia bacterium]|nr:DNA recombination protein RmuC [Actinomycetes bacterium]